jgi:hypothetical protein
MGMGHNPYEGVTKGELSWDDCLADSAVFDLALAYALQYPTAADAQAAGFVRVIPYAQGMGTHHAVLPPETLQFIRSSEFDPTEPTFPGSALDEVFDPKRPEFLQYDGNGPDAKLVGMSWYVRTDDGQPPEGFAGDNDFWHVHPQLCFGPGGGFLGQNLTDAECDNRAGGNGTNMHLEDYWMVHAWIVPGWTHESDVFVNHHPCLLPGGPAPHDHMCWTMSGGGHDH